MEASRPFRLHDLWRPFLAALTATAAIALAAGGAAAHPLPGAARCQIFPANNPWNQRVDRAPVARDSAQLVNSIGIGAHVHAAFGSGRWEGQPIGIPITVLSSPVPQVPVSFQFGLHSDHVSYPLFHDIAVETSSTDRHSVVVDPRTCRDYELYDLRQLSDGRWDAGAGAVFNLSSNRLRPAGWLSADAAGLPMLPGLARYSDVRLGSIDHALRFFAPYTRAAFVYPARHYGEDYFNPALPPMGLRVRLKARVNISGLPYQARIVALALKRYGMILADNGPAWYISGAPDSRWNNIALRTLGRLSGRDFEVVDTSRLPHPGQ